MFTLDFPYSVLPINPLLFPGVVCVNCSALLDQQEVREQFQFSACYIKRNNDNSRTEHPSPYR